MVDVASYETREDGYCRWRVWDSVEGRERYVYVHRLLALLEYELDDLDGKHVHHVSGIPYDNRLGNLEVRDPTAHGDYHLNGRAFADGGER